MLTKHEERIARLRDLEFLWSPAHQEKLWQCHESVYEPVVEFVHCFVDVASRQGIPVYCRKVGFDVVELVHAQFEDRLDDTDWIIFGQIGDEVVASYGVKATWGPNEGCDPSCWFVGEAVRQSDYELIDDESILSRKYEINV